MNGALVDWSDAVPVDWSLVVAVAALLLGVVNAVLHVRGNRPRVHVEGELTAYIGMPAVGNVWVLTLTAVNTGPAAVTVHEVWWDVVSPNPGPPVPKEHRRQEGIRTESLEWRAALPRRLEGFDRHSWVIHEPYEEPGRWAGHRLVPHATVVKPGWSRARAVKEDVVGSTLQGYSPPEPEAAVP